MSRMFSKLMARAVIASMLAGVVITGSALSKAEARSGSGSHGGSFGSRASSHSFSPNFHGGVTSPKSPSSAQSSFGSFGRSTAAPASAVAGGALAGGAVAGGALSPNSTAHSALSDTLAQHSAQKNALDAVDAKKNASISQPSSQSAAAQTNVYGQPVGSSKYTEQPPSYAATQQAASSGGGFGHFVGNFLMFEGASSLFDKMFRHDSPPTPISASTPSVENSSSSNGTTSAPEAQSGPPHESHWLRNLVILLLITGFGLWFWRRLAQKSSQEKGNRSPYKL
ncbi:MAG: hypothetical protein ACYC3A_11880 [Halothiobacillus sp.]